MSSRRNFLTRGLTLAGAAGGLVSALAPRAAFAQTQSGSVRRADRYDDSFIFERKPFESIWTAMRLVARISYSL